MVSVLVKYIENLLKWGIIMSMIAILKGLLGGKLLEPLLGKALEKGIEKVEKTIGKSVEEAEYDVTDEVLYNSAIYSLSSKEAEELDKFEEVLRKRDPEKAEAFVLFISKIIHVFEKDVKKTPKKKKEGSSEEEGHSFSYKDFSYGVRNAQIFLRSLLKRKGSNFEETFRKRVNFLESKNVFSLLGSQKKKEAVGPIETLMDFFITDNNVIKFNSLIFKLEQEKQKILIDFLRRLEYFQAKKFIRTVTKMSPGAKRNADQRIDFLLGFINYIEKYGFDEAFRYSLGTGLIKEESVLEKTKRIILGVKALPTEDLEELRKNLTSKIKESQNKVEEKSEDFQKSGKSFVKKALTFGLWK